MISRLIGRLSRARLAALDQAELPRALSQLCPSLRWRAPSASSRVPPGPARPHSKGSGRDSPLLNVERLRRKIGPESARDPLRASQSIYFIIAAYGTPEPTQEADNSYSGCSQARRVLEVDPLCRALQSSLGLPVRLGLERIEGKLEVLFGVRMVQLRFPAWPFALTTL